MSLQLDLLSYPNSPGFKSPGTSQEAAEKMVGRVAYLQGKCLDVLRRCDEWGLTPDQCASALGESLLSIRPRFTELKEMGLIEKTGERRKNASGMSATVWRVKA